MAIAAAFFFAIMLTVAQTRDSLITTFASACDANVSMANIYVDMLTSAWQYRNAVLEVSQVAFAPKHSAEKLVQHNYYRRFITHFTASDPLGEKVSDLECGSGPARAGTNRWARHPLSTIRYQFRRFEHLMHFLKLKPRRTA